MNANNDVGIWDPQLTGGGAVDSARNSCSFKESAIFEPELDFSRAAEGLAIVTEKQTMPSSINMTGLT